MVFQRRPRQRRLAVESLENRMVLSGLGLTMKGIELPVDGTPASEKVCVAKNAGIVQAAKGATASDTVVKPFKISGGGTADFLPLVPGTFSPFNATGTATNLGKYTGEGTLQVNAADNTFSSYEPFVFVGANGDEIHFEFEGDVVIEPVSATTIRSTWTATFTPVIGDNTGKFANVVGGSFTMIAQTGEFAPTDPDIPYTWKGSGELEYGKSLPYKGSGIGTYLPLQQTYDGSGNATQVGDHTFSGAVELTDTANPLVKNFVNPVPQVIVAANGDELWITLSGQVTLEPQGGDIFTAVWSGDGVVEGGTGKFANAMPGAQPLKVTAINAPFDIVNDAEWNFSWTLEGPIVLR